VSGRIRQEDLEAVRERTDIVKLVSGYLTLKKSGHDSFSGLCPFHTEKTPSFSVSASKGVYYCFGCGAGGDAIRFLREVEHLEFTEAVERLAKEAGITVRYEGDTPAERRAASRRQALHRANEQAFGLYHRMLLEGREGLSSGSAMPRATLTSSSVGLGVPCRQRSWWRRVWPCGIKRAGSEIGSEAGSPSRSTTYPAVRSGSGRASCRGVVTKVRST
jgi:hypothetical protein